MSGDSQSGVVIVRVWIEEREGGPELVARIIARDSESNEADGEGSSAMGIDAIVEIVRQRLVAFVPAAEQQSQIGRNDATTRSVHQTK